MENVADERPVMTVEEVAEPAAVNGDRRARGVERPDFRSQNRWHVAFCRAALDDWLRGQGNPTVAEGHSLRMNHFDCPQEHSHRTLLGFLTKSEG